MPICFICITWKEDEVRGRGQRSVFAKELSLKGNYNNSVCCPAEVNQSTHSAWPDARSRMDVAASCLRAQHQTPNKVPLYNQIQLQVYATSNKPTYSQHYNGMLKPTSIPKKHFPPIGMHASLSSILATCLATKHTYSLPHENRLKVSRKYQASWCTRGYGGWLWSINIRIISAAITMLAAFEKGPQIRLSTKGPTKVFTWQTLPFK